jgi:DinB superfamily
MNRYLMMGACVLAGAFGLQAQMPASHIAEGKQLYSRIKGSVDAIAEKMPDADYDFKATPEVRAFGGIVAHVADVQARLCSMVSGTPKSVGAGSKTTKADLVAALKESDEICDAAWDSLNAASAADEVNLGFLKGSKLMVLEYNTMHSDEEYGYMSVYARLKGVVPPTSAGRGGGGGRRGR